jgi:hypothetical protein
VTKEARIIEGGEEARQKLLGRLKKIFSGADAPSEEVEITLVQVAKMGEMAIHEFPYDGDGSLEDLVGEIIDEAEDDAAQHARGKVKYAMRIKSLGERTVFTLNIPSLDDDDDDYEDIDELPNRRGLIQQQMRHTEVLLKEAVSGGKADRSMLYGMIRDLQAENALLKKQWFEGQAIIENLRNMQFARDLEIEKLRKSEARKDQVAGMLLQTGPVLAAKLLGGGSGQADSTPTDQLGQRTPLEQMVEAFFMSLEQNPTALQKIAEGLDQGQLINLSNIHRYIAERREREAQIKAQQAAQQQPKPSAPPYSPYTSTGPYTPYSGPCPEPRTGYNGAPPQQGAPGGT